MPVYRDRPTSDEQTSLRHLARHLGRHPVRWLAPEGLNLDAYQDAVPHGAPCRFPAAHFASVHTYSRLLLTDAFYRAFTEWEYMLLYQLDALALADDLEAWCARGYDYVGAPWIARRPDGLRWVTGNSGFGLRRVEAALRVLTSRRFARAPAVLRTLAHAERRMRLLPAALLRRWVPVADSIVHAPGRWHGKDVAAVRRQLLEAVQGGVRRYLQRVHYNEDLFWSLVAPVFDPAFRVAPAEVAVRFAFEMEPRLCFEQAGRRLPFGCHAWARYDRAFWEPHLLR